LQQAQQRPWQTGDSPECVDDDADGCVEESGLVVDEKGNCNVRKRKEEREKSGHVTMICDCVSELNLNPGSATVSDILTSQPYPSKNGTSTF